MQNDTAASDLIGVVALIAVFVTAAAIVGVTLLSHLPGDQPPAVLVHSETEGGKIYIYHDSGDPLEWGQFTIFVDGVNQTDNVTLINASGTEPDTWTSWKTGEVLLISDGALASENPRIQIVGEGMSRTSSTWLLYDTGTT